MTANNGSDITQYDTLARYLAAAYTAYQLGVSLPHAYNYYIRDKPSIGDY